MKTRMFLPVFVLSLVILLQGCTKDTTEPVNPPATLTYDVKANKDTVKKGESVTFEWTSNAKLCTLSINGAQESVSVKGKKDFPLTQNTFFVFTFTSETKSVKVETFSKMVFVKDEVLPKAPTFSSLTASPNRTDVGGSALITFSTTDADSVTSNLVGVHGTSGSFPTPALQKTTTYTFKAWGKGGTAVDSITIVVNEPPVLTFMNYITAHPWGILSKQYKYYEGDLWVPIEPSPESLLNKHIFQANNWWECYNKNVLIGNGPFSITDSVLTWGVNKKIIALNETTMVIKFKVICLSGCPTDSIIYQETYSVFNAKKK